jgi:hypothetical protein
MRAEVGRDVSVRQAGGMRGGAMPARAGSPSGSHVRIRSQCRLGVGAVRTDELCKLCFGEKGADEAA